MDIGKALLEIRLYLDDLREKPKEQWEPTIIKINKGVSIHLKVTGESVKLVLIKKEDEAS